MKDRLKFMEELALQAGKLILSYRNNVNVEFKGEATNNFVTDADTKTEEFIISSIKKEYPDDSFLAEESGLTKTINNNLWIIDPLDGTNNFSRGIPQFCTSIAYAEHGEVKAGCIYDPERDELFSASKGNGTYLNGEKINVSTRNKINETIIATGFYYDRGIIMEKTLETIHNLFKNNICGLRRLGSAALDLCWVACGRYDAYFEYKLHPWDFAAGMLIVREASGKCYDKFSNNMNLNGEGIIATNTNLEKKFVDIVKID